MQNTKCPLCGAIEDYTVLYKSNFNAADFNPEIFSARRLPDTIHYQIVKCKNDGLVRSTPVYDQTKSDILYKRSKFTYAEQVENLTISYLRVLTKVLPRLSPQDRILEIGCGNGFVLSALAKKGYQQVYGLEPSLDAAAKADPLIKDRITTEVLKEGLYPPASFAFIYFMQTLDHIPDPLKFLSICYDLLSPGGMVLALNHDMESFSARMLKEKSPIIDLEHMYLYSQDTVGRLFSKSGFTPVKIFSPASVISWRYLCWLLPLPKVVKIRILQAKGRVNNCLLKKKINIRLGNLCIIAEKPINDSPGNPAKETWQPLPNVSPGDFKGTILFYLRLFFDISVFTVYKDVKKYLLATDNSILEVGCGLKPYRHLVPEGVKYFAVDWKGAKDNFHYNTADTIYYDGDTLPLKDTSFKYLFHTEVLEHVYDLDQFLKECCRVLSMEGRMFFTIPFAARNHYIPYDYWRLTPASLEKLLIKAGFTNILVKPRGSDIIVAITKINILFIRTIMRAINNPVLGLINKAIFGFLFIIPLISFVLLEHVLLLLKVGSADDPLGYSVYCQKAGLKT